MRVSAFLRLCRSLDLMFVQAKRATWAYKKQVEDAEAWVDLEVRRKKTLLISLLTRARHPRQTLAVRTECRLVGSLACGAAGARRGEHCQRGGVREDVLPRHGPAHQPQEGLGRLRRYEPGCRQVHYWATHLTEYLSDSCSAYLSTANLLSLLDLLIGLHCLCLQS